MSSEEKNKEQSLENIVESFTEGIREENDEKKSPEEAPEEVSIEETPVEETPVEETPVEEAETTQEETPVEPVEEVNAEKKSKKAWIIGMSVFAAILVILAGVYLGVASYYKERFLMGTFVNEVDCSGKTLNEVGAMLQKQVEEYKLTVYEINDATEVIEGTAIDIKYGGYKKLKDAFNKQNPYAWPKALFEQNKITTEIIFEYSSEKLDKVITELTCMQAENQVAPISASVVYGDGKFVIQSEVYGTQLEATKVNEVIHAGVASMAETVNLVESGCYIQPTYKSDSNIVVSALNEVNKYLSAKITYSLDGIEVVVDRAVIAPWVSVGENYTPVIDIAKVKAFTDTLGAKYNTANQSGTLTTPNGKVVTVSVARFGRQVGSQADCDQLVNEIKAGQTVTRSPILSRQETPEGQYAWGNTYAEVDITQQHMWYIVNGEVVFETDVVTGKKGVNDTPTGTYTVLEKIPGKYLTGRIVNGKPLYRTWVNYWMRLTWSGIGFHDAGWQNGIFGGERYVTNGSHGCINMPPDKAKEFYGMISVGTPTIIHY